MIEGDKRNVPADGGALDLNRMFSRAGAQRNLRSLSPGRSAAQIGAVLDKLDRGSDRLVRAVLPRSGGLVFAVHNNSEGYSVRDEVSISDRVSLADGPIHTNSFCAPKARITRSWQRGRTTRCCRTAPRRTTW